VGIGKVLEPEEEATGCSRFKSEKDMILGGDAGTEAGVFKKTEGDDRVGRLAVEVDGIEA
jgi:hypothetical protein